MKGAATIVRAASQPPKDGLIGSDDARELW
jgi:hypothetical protein